MLLSSAISSTTKSTGYMNLSTLTRTSSTIPRGCTTERSANCNVICVGFTSPMFNFLNNEQGSMLTLAPRSQSALVNFMLPMVQGIEKFPGSLNFGGNLFIRSALLSSVNMTVSCSPSFFFFETNSLRNFTYFGICSSISANGILICKLLNIFRNFEYCLSSVWSFSLLGNGGRLYLATYSLTLLSTLSFSFACSTS